MAMHTQNLKTDPRCSLFIGQALADGDPLGVSRATLIVMPNRSANTRLHLWEIYLGRHENSRYRADFSDFGFFRLQPIDLYYVGGFGMMGWVEAKDYEEAAPDPLAEAAPGILGHMNADHVDSMVLLARSLAHIEAADATMTAVDRLGFNFRLKTDDGMKGTRINFPREVFSPQDTRTILVDMVRQVKQ